MRKKTRMTGDFIHCNISDTLMMTWSKGCPRVLKAISSYQTLGNPNTVILGHQMGLVLISGLSRARLGNP